MTVLSDASGSTQASSALRPNGRRAWLVPVLAFLLGALLAGVVVAAVAGDDDGDDVSAVASPTPSRAPSATALPTPTPGDLLVRVPDACLDVAEQAENIARQVDEVARAAADLDARRLQELVDGFQALQPEVERLAQECQSAADAGVVVDTPTPALTS